IFRHQTQKSRPIRAHPLRGRFGIQKEAEVGASVGGGTFARWSFLRKKHPMCRGRFARPAANRFTVLRTSWNLNVSLERDSVTGGDVGGRSQDVGTRAILPPTTYVLSPRSERTRRDDRETVWVHTLAKFRVGLFLRDGRDAARELVQISDPEAIVDRG